MTENVLSSIHENIEGRCGEKETCLFHCQLVLEMLLNNYEDIYQ